MKRRGEKAHCYLKRRDGDRVVTDYAGTAAKVESALRRQADRRKAAETALRQLKAEQRFMERSPNL